MKKYSKFFAVALTAVMAIGSIAFVSCDKENELLNPQDQTVVSTDNPTTKKIYPIDEDFKDAQGQVWHVKGHGHNLNYCTVELDVNICYPNGTIRHFTGTVKILPDGTCSVIGCPIRLTPELIQFLTEYVSYLLGL